MFYTEESRAETDGCLGAGFSRGHPGTSKPGSERLDLPQKGYAGADQPEEP